MRELEQQLKEELDLETLKELIKKAKTTSIDGNLVQTAEERLDKKTSSISDHPLGFAAPGLT